MIQRIQQSRAFKAVSVFLILNILAEIVAPMRALALTGGPAQPEFGSFTPIGTSDMVDLSSGDMNYNIPLMDVGGYPLNIAYSSGTGMDDEASWVGLGWNLSVGQVNRNVRGLPDDFNGDEMVYENHMKPNVTVGASFKLTPNAFGTPVEDLLNDVSGSTTVSYGVSAIYNNYSGFSMKPSVGVQMDLGKYASVGFNAESGPDGLSLSPSFSLHGRLEDANNKYTKITGTVGVSMNSRQGLSTMTLGMSKQSVNKSRYKNKGGEHIKYSSGSVGSSIGYTDNLYTPNKRVAMNTESFTVNAAIGSEFFGGEAQGQITAYGTIQSIEAGEREKHSRAYGYQNTEQAGTTGILDFNREKDGNFSVNSTNLPLTNYTYDVYSVQGQGVSGMYRPYRNQVGYVFDAHVQDASVAGTLGLEFGVGNAAHGGADFEASVTESQSGKWSEDNYILQYLIENYNYNPRYEKVHFKNVGDLSTDEDFQLFDQVGRYQPTRVSYIGNKFHRRAVNELKYKYNGEGNEYIIGVGAATKRTQRQTRNQSVRNVTVAEVLSGVGYGPCVKRSSATPEYQLPSGAKSHHTAEVQIIRNDGARYIYGLPAYNTTKREASFSVYGENGNCSTGLVGYQPDVDNSADNNIHDETFNRTTTPAYAHTYLLTSVLSTDYYDKNNDGPTVDDFGSYTKFTYTNKLKEDTETHTSTYRWRVPYEQNKATYNQGLNTDTKDDQGNYVYGEKEQLYVKQIETKTHIAIFELSRRKDANGVLGENGGLDDNDQFSYKLDNIKLYSRAEYEANPTNALPIKTVNFVYSYSLCQDVPNNNDSQSLTPTELSNKGGKLTLKKIYFTYRDSKMGKYTGYKFNYNEFNGGLDEFNTAIGSLVTNTTDNPNYNIKGYDSWGNYMPNGDQNLASCANTDPVTAAEYPFTAQNKNLQDTRSSVWCLKKIYLPSGGNIGVTYESDDYAYVQDRSTLRMYKVVGAGRLDNPGTVNGTQLSDVLYSATIENLPNHYLYVEIPEQLPNTVNTSTDEATIKKMFFNHLIKGRIHFRFFMNMTMAGGDATSKSTLDNAKFDYVTGYAQWDPSRTTKIFTDPANTGKRYLSVPIETVDREGGVDPSKQVNPISKATWHFGRKYLSQHVYSNQPNGDTEDIEAIVSELLSGNVMSNIKEIFTGPNVTLENKFIGRRFIKDKSWIRLGEPTKKKLGGGTRVQKIAMNDIWEEMYTGIQEPNGAIPPNSRTMSYGQEYKYNLEDEGEMPENYIFTSSGVATYEPVGNKENPFVQPVVATTKHLLAPDEENYVEEPFGESFFPNPQVTYSRVRVSNLTAGQAPVDGMKVKDLHRTGYVVSEFYTSKDYPTIVDQTILEAKEDKKQLLANLLKLNVKKHFTASQGYVIHLNDMNGKQKAQWVYAQGQASPISGVEYHYDKYTSAGPANTERNKGTLDNKVKVIYPNGDIKMETIGVEYDIVHDFRMNESKTVIPGINANLATFLVGIIPGIVPVPLPDLSTSEDKFRSVSTTKVINTFGLLKETVAYEDGAAVHTRNLAWDAMTGEVLVTETVDEFSDKYYTFNYPAHWYYKGMAQASLNLGIDGTLTASGGGYAMQNLPASYMSKDFLIDGDEIVYGALDANGIRPKAWVVNVAGNTFRLLDKVGNNITGLAAGTKFTVIRSGHRNLQSAGIMNVTLMRNPLKNTNGTDITNLGTSFLSGDTWDDWRIINAGAVDYSDYWPAGCECDVASVQVGTTFVTNTNPYTKNQKGVWRTKSSQTYLTGRYSQAEVTPRQDGFFTKFDPFYKLTASNNWYKNTNNWTFVSEVSIYSPYGFELENKDALNRYSAAQYGYNNTLPMAVGANTKYREIGFDGFEDYGFVGCAANRHFSFKEATGGQVSNAQSHTGKYSIKVNANSNSTLNKKIACPPTAQP
jgi:hypothetical protein